MTSLDDSVALFFNGYVRQSWVFDQALAFLSANHLMKGAVFMAIVWWAWFRSRRSQAHDREQIVVTLLSCLVALVLGRTLVLALPMRLRPMHQPELDLVLAYGLAPGDFDQLSSFPSDHAVLFFALATGLWFISRRVGVFAFAYAVVCIALPRLYLGIHYPSDILAGALIGIAVAVAGNVCFRNTGGVRRVAALSETTPQYFYPLSFLLTYQIAELFESSRWVVRGLFKLAMAVA